MTNGPEFERLESHLRGSWLVRIIDASATVWRVAATRSAVVRALRSAIARFSSVAPAARLRAVAVFVATAAVGHLILLRFVPPHIAPALPKPMWMLVAAAAVVVALVPERLIAGWESSFVSRIWRVQLSRRPSGL
jgi:hypothetical protein